LKNFNLNSNQLAVSDFVLCRNGNTDTKTEAMKSCLLNASLTAKANTVLYDNLTLKDVSG
jgi:hypothetical protein